jgi:hypothetical protein
VGKNESAIDTGKGGKSAAQLPGDDYAALGGCWLDFRGIAEELPSVGLVVQQARKPLVLPPVTRPPRDFALQFAEPLAGQFVDAATAPCRNKLALCCRLRHETFVALG